MAKNSGSRADGRPHGTVALLFEGRSPGDELVTGANKLPEPVALRGPHRLDDDVMVPPVRTDPVDAVDVRILHGTVELTHSQSYAIPAVVGT